MAKFGPVAAASRAAPDICDKVVVELDDSISSYAIRPKVVDERCANRGALGREGGEVGGFEIAHKISMTRTH